MKPAVPRKLPRTGLDWERLIPQIGAANRALARYDGVLQGVPNPVILLSPMTTQEAVLSSRIEGTRATLDEVLKFEAGEEVPEEERRLDILEIINYRRALHVAEAALQRRPFNLNLLRELHGTLLDGVRGRDKARGRFRTVQNYIAPPGAGLEQALFIPPEPSRVMEHMDNWEKYYHADERDALVQLAIVHAQFEIIHPFVDGNGRLGRMLVPLFLFERTLLSRPMFYLSAYLEAHRDEYYALLRALDGPETWNRWIAFFLLALAEQAQANSEKARGILELYARLKEQVLSLTHSQYAVPLLDHLFRQPIFRPSTLFELKGMPSKPMVMELLRKLRDAGILGVLREARGRRGQILVLTELVDLSEGREVV
ncbi:MAG: cell filamentation protein Fic [Chloroflexi bacterium RBG_13_68_17]|nr:MAG: cell filamentation protein Fic [Chloroflexi bacterium RBG_13_68_17]